MKSTGKSIAWATLCVLCVFFPYRLFAQWYGDVSYRFGLDKRSSSPLEIAQLNVPGALSKPYTLGGYTISTGYAWHPDSMITVFKSGLSYWNSRSGTLMYTPDHNNPTRSWIQHQMVTVDLGLAFEFNIYKTAASTGLTILIPVYMVGSEVQKSGINSDLTSQTREIEYRKGPGICINQDIEIWSKGQTKVFAGLNAGWIRALRKSRILISADPSQTVSQQNLQYLTDAQVQKKGSINDPSLSGFNPNIAMETQTYHEPLSFVSFKLGFRIALK